MKRRGFLGLLAAIPAGTKASVLNEADSEDPRYSDKWQRAQRSAARAVRQLEESMKRVGLIT